MNFSAHWRERKVEAIVKKAPRADSNKEWPLAAEPRPPSAEAAALAALSISESLILALAESGAVDPARLSRWLHDAAGAYSAESPDPERQRVREEASQLIDRLLNQIYAAAPPGHLRPADVASDPQKSRPKT